MSALQISLFGKFQARFNDQPLTGLEAQKVQDLFCYILLYRERPHPRETLADILWPNTAQSRKYLRKALWQFQSVLDAQTQLKNAEVLIVEPDWVQFNPQANIWLDIVTFEQAFAQVQGVSGNELDNNRAKILQKVVELYQGDLLEGCYAEWCLYERERFQHLYLAILDKLMAYCEANRQYEMGVFYGIQALRYDRARERTHRRLMRLYYLSGYRTEALRQYDRCVRVLDKELSVEPSQRTKTLYQQICSDKIVAPQPPSQKALCSATSLTEVLDRLQQLQTSLAKAQHQIQNDIQIVKQTQSD